MMNIREYFNNLYVQAQGNEEQFDEVAELEQQVYDWYCDEDSRWDEFVEQNNIDLDDVENMMDGSQEYVLTLWCWDMCGD